MIMLSMKQVENQVKLFSLEEQLHLLAYIANTISERNTNIEKSVSQKTKRHAGGLSGKFWMAYDFDETPDCFKDYM